MIVNVNSAANFFHEFYWFLRKILKKTHELVRFVFVSMRTCIGFPTAYTYTFWKHLFAQSWTANLQVETITLSWMESMDTFSLFFMWITSFACIVPWFLVCVRLGGSQNAFKYAGYLTHIHRVKIVVSRTRWIGRWISALNLFFWKNVNQLYHWELQRVGDSLLTKVITIFKSEEDSFWKK